MICYHHNDLDGRAAAAVVSYTLNEYNPHSFIESDYSGLKTELCADMDDVWIVDYSFTEDTLPTLLELLDRASHVTWIDHHDSSLDLIESHPELKAVDNLSIYVSKDHSGCMLTYQYLHGEEDSMVPLFLRLISDYDNWDREHPDSYAFVLGMNLRNCRPTSALYRRLTQEFLDNFTSYEELDCLDEVFLSVVKTSCPLLSSIWEDGQVVESYANEQNRKILQGCGFESEFHGYRCFCVNSAYGNSMMFGAKLLRYPLCIAFYFDGTQYNYSLYSDSDRFEVSCKSIAEEYGGGGHIGAAGFRSKDLLV